MRTVFSLRNLGVSGRKAVCSWLTVFALGFIAEAAFAQKAQLASPKAPKRTLQAKAEMTAEYLTPSVPSWEIRTAPIALFAAWYTVDVAYRITDQFATGPAFVSYGCDGPGGMLAPCFKGSAYGWQANYYAKSLAARRGVYVGTRAYYEDYVASPHGSLYSKVDAKGFRGNVMAGLFAPAFLGMLWHFGIGWEMRDQQVTRYSSDQLSERPKEPRTSGRENHSGPMLEAKLGIQF